MTIQEQLNAINETFVKLHKDFMRFEADKQALSSKYSLEYGRVQEKWNKERDRITVVREDVLKYYRIAKDNSSKELLLGKLSIWQVSMLLTLTKNLLKSVQRNSRTDTMLTSGRIRKALG